MPLPAAPPPCAVPPTPRPEQICLDHLDVVVERNVLKASERANPGVVDPNVDAAQGLYRRLREFVYVLLNAYVRWNRYCPAAATFALARDFVEQFVAPRSE